MLAVGQGFNIDRLTLKLLVRQGRDPDHICSGWGGFAMGAAERRMRCGTVEALVSVRGMRRSRTARGDRSHSTPGLSLRTKLGELP